MPKGYANGMMAEGRILMTGGIVGWDERGVFPEGFAAQTRQALGNIRAILAAGGADPHHIVRLTWYVVDVDEYLAGPKELGRAYREVLEAHYPAMTLVQVVRLVEREARLEIEATAVVPNR
jgi:enamine deaminase RidA (YjgF/YER057c/UK114 family)